MPLASPRLRRAAVRAALLLAAAGPAAAQTAPSRAVLAERVDSLATAFLAEAPATGLTLAVVRGRDTIAHKGYGLADVEEQRPARPATVYRIGSITKQFTSAAIMQLVEQKRIALDDTLGRFLPEYPQWSRVTIRQLLNHTSGIHSYTASSAWQTRMAQQLAPDTVLGFVARDTFDFAPGTGYRYNNTGYFLLGQVLERVTKSPYARHVTERFFRPLGMRSASYCPSTITDTTHASGYDKRPVGQPVPAGPVDMSSPYSAGALCMSVGDYLKWQTALTSGRIVRPESYALMTRSDTLINGRPTNYGFALAPADLGGHRVIQHGGDINGFSVQQLWLPDDSLRVVVFTNTLGSSPDRLARNIARAMVGVPIVQPPRPPAVVTLTAADRARYVGSYALALPDRTLGIRVFEQDGRLMAEAEGQGANALTPQGDHAFGAAFDPSLRITFTVDGERATKLTLRQGGGTFEAPRIARP